MAAYPRCCPGHGRRASAVSESRCARLSGCPSLFFAQPYLHSLRTQLKVHEWHAFGPEYPMESTKVRSETLPTRAKSMAHVAYAPVFPFMQIWRQLLWHVIPMQHIRWPSFQRSPSTTPRVMCCWLPLLLHVLTSCISLCPQMIDVGPGGAKKGISKPSTVSNCSVVFFVT